MPRKTPMRKNSSRSRQTRNRRNRVSKGGGCGCNKSAANPLSVFNGGSAADSYAEQPSFSMLHQSKFYPLNTMDSDIQRSAVSSRLIPGGGKRSRRNKKRQPRKQTGGNILNYMSSYMGTGFHQNPVFNMGSSVGALNASAAMTTNPPIKNTGAF